VKLYLLRQEPAQQIAAHPDTLTVITSADRWPSLLGLPLVPDPAVRPGWLHLRPLPHHASAAPGR